MAQSVLDAGWSTFKTQLLYKSHWLRLRSKKSMNRFPRRISAHAGLVLAPRVRSELHLATWTCPCCGVVHDRNRNTVQNILVCGLREIEKENSSSAEPRADEADVNKDYGSRNHGLFRAVRIQIGH
jgi:transposase